MLAIAFLLLRPHREPPPSSLTFLHITPVDTRGEPVDAAISADGKLLAYVVSERPGQSVWFRNSSGWQETVAVSPQPGDISGLTFSPDDAFLYYRHKEVNGAANLYRVPVKGGASEEVVADISGAPSISPDGRRLAFVRLKPSTWEASLIVSNVNGTGELTLAKVHRPRYFDQHSVAWSPDGRSIACFAGQAANYSESKFQLVEVRLADGTQHPITPRSWMWPHSVAWSATGDVLVVTAATRGDDLYQLFAVLHSNGAVTRLTNDLSNYDRVTLTMDGKTIAAVHSETSAAIWVSKAGDPANPVRISAVPLHSTHVAVAWTPGGRVVYSDPTGDYRNLWIMDSDGGNRRRLTFGPGNKDQIAVARDGQYIVYKQDGNIWRVNSDGTHLLRLTHGSLDVHPDISPDGRSVIYASFTSWSPAVGGAPTLWKVPINGGDPLEISSQPASFPRVSPDGRQVACTYFPSQDPRVSAGHVALLALHGSGAFRIFDASPTEDTPLHWSPSGNGVDLVLTRANAANLWQQPLDGAPPVQITSLGLGDIYDFAWSHTGRLAVAQGSTTRGLVLLENSQ